MYYKDKQTEKLMRFIILEGIGKLKLVTLVGE